MERYKFRGKGRTEGEWVYGYLIEKWWYGSNQFYISEGVYGSDDICESVDPCTIGQCTGTKDKNGSLVYEGDICRTSNGTLMTVTFDGDRFVFKNENNSFGLSYYANSVEIIGTIHDKETD